MRTNTLSLSSFARRAARAGLILSALLAVLPAPAQAALFGEAERTGSRNECMKRHSRAWCVWDAADMSHKLEDVPAAQFDKALQDSGITILDVAFSAGVGTGLLRPPSIGTKWTEISVVLLGALLEKKPAVLGFNKVIAWMPYEMAPSAEAADELLLNMLLRATREALNGYVLEVSTRNYNPHLPRSVQRLTWNEHLAWEVTGPECAPDQCWLWHQRVGHSQPLPPKEGKAPEWLGGYKAWVFDLRSGPSMFELWTGRAYETNRYAAALSRQLPEWLFLSLTPERAHPSGFGGKPLVFNPGVRMPILLNKGQALLAVFPELPTRTNEGNK